HLGSSREADHVRPQLHHAARARHLPFPLGNTAAKVQIALTGLIRHYSRIKEPHDVGVGDAPRDERPFNGVHPWTYGVVAGEHTDSVARVSKVKEKVLLSTDLLVRSRRSP